jgi:hypothetical protein
MVRFAHATPASITDTTPGTAVVDGTIDPAEYSAYTEGINRSAGGIIGEGAKLYIDSGGPLDEIVFGIEPTPTSQLSDYVVIYIDSIGGGVANTAGLADKTDYFTKAISGTEDHGSAHLHFAPGFAADYALAINYTGARLYQLAEGGDGSLNFIGSANLTPEDNISAGQYEFNIAMSDIGIIAGDSFRYVATLTYPSYPGFFRFSEFNGVSQATYDANSADLQDDFHLASGDYHTFTTMSPTAVGQLNSRSSLLSGSGTLSALFLVVLPLATCSLYVVRRRSRRRPV